MKKILLIALTLLVCFSLFACDSIIEPIDFIQNGLQITLDTSFNQIANTGYTACFRSSVVTVYCLREAFTDDLKEDVTLAEYAEKVLVANGLQREVGVAGDHLTFIYETEAENLHIVRYVCLYKMSDCFWTVQFVCQADYYESLEESFIEWANTVKDVKVNAETKE